MDKNEKVIGNYNPKELEAVNEIRHEIKENEQLVGFYVVDEDKLGTSFSSFGFIVKVR